MAIIHVSDVAAGANNGTSWTDAYTSIVNAGVLGATGGTDEIWVDKDHTEGATGTVNIAFTGGTLDDPITIYSIDKDASDAYVPGALIDTSATGGITLSGHVRWFGVNLSCTQVQADLNFGGQFENVIELWDSTFTSGDRMESASLNVLRAYNCVFSIGDTTNGWRVDVNNALLQFRKCTFTHGSTALFSLVSSFNVILCEDCDLGTDSDFLLGDSSGEKNNTAVFRRCKLTSSYQLHKEAVDVRGSGLVESSTADTDETPLGLQEYADYYGVVKSDDARFRTGGASDGVTAHSWEMVANGKTREFFQPLKSPPITVWVAGGASKTFKIFVASAVTLQNDECWIELSGPDNTATSTTQGYRETTKVGWTTSIEGDPQATPANLMTDGSSSWDGTGVGTLQEMSVTYTPDQEGPVTIRVCLAKAATVTIYVDPKIEVT